MRSRDVLSLVLAGVLSVLATGLSPSALALENDELDRSAISGKPRKSTYLPPHAHTQNGQAHASQGIPFIDSLVNWSDHYFVDGLDSFGNPQREWFTNTVGNPPWQHGTTYINAPIIPVSVQLLDWDGSNLIVDGVNMYSDATQVVEAVLNSPLFRNASYPTSAGPTQFLDAFQRAAYWAKAKEDWHTILVPSAKTPRVMNVPRGQYQFMRNADGSCCFYILIDGSTFVDLLFPMTADDTTTPIGAAENAGEITTKDVASMLFRNVVLGSGDFCCTNGFHSYDYEPATDRHNIEKRYVVNFSSWYDYDPAFPDTGDIYTLTHEIAETLNDPFVGTDGVHNFTPWWLSTGDFAVCANFREVGDPIEVFSSSSYPITMSGFTYNPTNLALPQWLQRTSPSDAFGGAYSFPNMSILTQLSPPLGPGCE